MFNNSEKVGTDVSTELILFKSGDVALSVPITPEENMVWLSQAQMVELYGRDVSVISRHINNVFKEGEVEKESNLHFLQIAGSDRPTAFYSLDVIISVGYRIKSKRGVEFRKWANSVLKDYILRGCAVNEARIRQLGEVVRLMKRTQNDLDSRQVLSVIERYGNALELLDDYDHQTMKRPKGTDAAYMLTYEECRRVIDQMRFGNESDLFGHEKDDSFKGSIGNIYQSFGGQEVYTFPGGESSESAVFRDEESQFSGRQQADRCYHISLFPGSEWDAL